MPLTLHKLRRFLAWPAAEQRLLLETVCWLGIARLGTVLLPFRRLAPGLGTQMLETLRVELPPEQSLRCRQIRRSIQRAAQHVPWRAVCLQQAIAAKVMLRRRGIPATLYFGVRKSAEPGGIAAHAWVRAGLIEVVASGGDGEPAFSVVAVFA